MNVLIFGGQSPNNQQWMKSLSSVLYTQAGNYKAVCHDYLAWTTEPDSNASKQISNEITSAQSKYHNRNFNMIIGKSFGCLMALEAGIDCQKIILIAPPILALKKLGFDLMKAVKKIDARILIAVNINDPLVEISELEKHTLEDPQRIRLRILAGNQHKYENHEELTRIIVDFMAKK